VTSPFTEVQLSPLGGAVARMDRGAMALEVPDARWTYFALVKWWDEAGQEDHVAWGRELAAAMRPWTADTAPPPNFIGIDEGHERLVRFYGPEKYRRLVALKDRYDPGNVFALNQNIPPSRT
jgi:hypothetical protein